MSDTAPNGGASNELADREQQNKSNDEQDLPHPTSTDEQPQDSSSASAPFTPRSILRKRDTTANASVLDSTTKNNNGEGIIPDGNSGGEGSNLMMRSTSSNAQHKRAKISGDISFMPDVFYEPSPSALFLGSSRKGVASTPGEEEDGADTEHQALPPHERLYKIAETREEQLEAKRAALQQAAEVKFAKQCTFDPKTTRKKGKGGAERAKLPPYATFNEFIQHQERWLKSAPKRIEKLIQQHKDIEAGKRDPRSEMGKTTKALVSKMQKESRYEHPVKDWDKRFGDFVLRKSSDVIIDEMMSGGHFDPNDLTLLSTSTATNENDNNASAVLLSNATTSLAANTTSFARKRLHVLESHVHPFSPVISAYAEAKAARECSSSKNEKRIDGGEASLSPIRQTWEQDPVAYASRTDVPFRARRASDSVFDKLYHESAVRAAATRVLKESYIENELSTFFKPRTNSKSAELAWQFSASRSRSGTVLNGRDRPYTIIAQSEEEDFVEFADGSYCFNGQHYADDGTHIGPAPDCSQCVAAAVDESDGYRGESSLAHLSDLSGFPRNPDEVVDSLLQKGEEYKERRERRRQQVEESKKEFPFKPMTNKKSHKILADFAKRAEEELTNELARRAMAEMNEGIVDSPDTVPEGVKGIPIPKKASKFNVNEFTRRIERAAAVKTAKLQALIEQRDTEELGECSFRPALAVNSLRGFSPAGPRRAHNIYTPGSVASTYSAAYPTFSGARLSASAIRCRTPNSHNASRSFNTSPLDTRHRFVSKREHADGPLLTGPSSSSVNVSRALNNPSASLATPRAAPANNKHVPKRRSSVNDYSQQQHDSSSIPILSREAVARPTLVVPRDASVVSSSTTPLQVRQPASLAAPTPTTAGGASVSHATPTTFGGTAAYEIPLANVPAARRVDPMSMLRGRDARSSSLGPVSSTDSQFHDHHDEEDELIERGVGMGGLGNANAHVPNATTMMGHEEEYANAIDESADEYLDAIENEMRDVLADWRSAARGQVGSIRNYQ